MAVALLLATLVGVGVEDAAFAADVSVPPTIDATGTIDVTAALAAFLAGVPDGSTVQFPSGGRYRVEGTLTLWNRHNLTIEGNGAEVFATTPGDRTRSQWNLIGGSRLVFRNLRVRGAHPNGGTSDSAYVADKEAQHGFNVEGVQGLELDRVHVSDVYGDFVYLGKFVADGGAWTTDAWIHDSVFERNGRQGIALTGAEGVTIERNVITQTRRATFDLEPNGAGWGVRNVRIVNNDIGPGRLNFVSAHGSGPVDTVSIEGNRLVGRAMNSSFNPPKGTRRSNLRIINNTSDSPYGNPDGGTIYIVRHDGAEVRGNVHPLPSGQSLVMGWEDCGITVEGNQVSPGSESTIWHDIPCPTPPPSTWPASGAPSSNQLPDPSPTTTTTIATSTSTTTTDRTTTTTQPDSTSTTVSDNTTTTTTTPATKGRKGGGGGSGAGQDKHRVAASGQDASAGPSGGEDIDSGGEDVDKPRAGAVSGRQSKTIGAQLASSGAGTGETVASDGAWRLPGLLLVLALAVATSMFVRRRRRREPEPVARPDLVRW